MRAAVITYFLAWVALTWIVPSALAETIPSNEAGAHVGQTVTVEGRAAEVFTDRRSGTTFIDLSTRYPDNGFSAVIFSADAAAFPGVDGLAGKTVVVTGPVRLYRGKPEIVLHDGSQLGAR